MKTKERSLSIDIGGWPAPRTVGYTAPAKWNSQLYPLQYDTRKPFVPPPLEEYAMQAQVLGVEASVPLSIGYERIDYRCGLQRYNPCRHIKSHGFDYPVTVDRTKSGGPTRNIIAGRRDVRRVSPFTIEGPYVNQWKAASARAWQTMQPKFASKVDMSVALLELRDFRGALQVLHKIWRGKFWDLLWQYERWCKQNPLAIASDIILSLFLAIRPFISQLKDLWAEIKQSIEGIQAQFAIMAEGNTSHYTEMLHYEPTLTVDPGVNGDVWRFSGTVEKQKFTATARLTWDYKLRSSFDAIERYFGFDGSYADLWELTRLSFVIDYFLKIGKAINAMERDINVSNVQCLRYVESVKTEKASGLFADRSADVKTKALLVNGSSVNGVTPYSGYKSVIYERNPCEPYMGLYIPKVAGKISATQGSILTALTISMLS